MKDLKKFYPKTCHVLLAFCQASLLCVLAISPAWSQTVQSPPPASTATQDAKPQNPPATNPPGQPPTAPGSVERPQDATPAPAPESKISPKQAEALFRSVDE